MRWLALEAAAFEVYRCHRLAVLTNGDQDQQEDKLVSIGIDGFVRDLFTSSRLPAAKPHPHCLAQWRS